MQMSITVSDGHRSNQQGATLPRNDAFNDFDKLKLKNAHGD